MWALINIRFITSRTMRWEGHVAFMAEIMNSYRILVRKPQGKRPPGRPRCGWEDNMRIYLQEVRWGDWLSGFIWLSIGTGGGRLVSAGLNFRFPQNAGNFLTSWRSAGFWGRITTVGILILATPARLDTRTAGVTRQCNRKDGSFPYLHT